MPKADPPQAENSDTIKKPQERNSLAAPL